MSEPLLTDREREQLLALVHQTVGANLRDDGEQPATPPDSDGLASTSGAFVSLYVAGQLRGCIGNMVSADPLSDTVERLAILASTNDSRFEPIAASELAQLRVEISVLSPLRVASAEDVRVGKHGIMLTNGHHRGVLLPQVATKYGWDREAFLAQTALKAGLPKHAWRDRETVIEIFEAEVFGDD